MKKRKKREKTIYVDELFEHFFSLGYTLRISGTRVLWCTAKRQPETPGFGSPLRALIAG